MYEPSDYVHVPELDPNINPTDKVYHNATSGRFIKVRVLREERSPGMPQFGSFVYKLSGSNCSSDGHALASGAGFQVVPAHTVTVASDAVLASLAETLEAERLKVAAATERAAHLEEEAAALG